MTILHTARLRLEPFADHHLDGLNAMNSRPEVMRFFGGQPETREQTAGFIARVQRAWAAWGTSWWALIDPENDRVAGAACVQYLRKELKVPDDLSSLVTNPLEVGWRLHPDYWHKGLATEAGERLTAFAFETFPIEELLSVCHPGNTASSRVMERLGMQYRGLETWYGQSLSTYVLGRDAWAQRVGEPGSAAT